MYEFLNEDDFATAKANGLSYDVVYKRFYYSNWSKEDAISKPVRVQQPSLWSVWMKTAVENNVSRYLFYYRTKKLGWEPETAATTPSQGRGRKRVFTKEQEEIAANNGIPYKTVYHRVYEYKWPIERAITEPVNESKRSRGKWNI